jgi:opacity protein-like surface antigen
MGRAAGMPEIPDMRTSLILAVVFTCGAALPSAAQDVPKVEVGGGYSTLHDEETHDNLNGFLLSFAANVNRWLAFGAEFGHNHKGGDSGAPDVSAFMAGPRVALRKSKAVPFGHFLVGSHHEHHDAGGAFDEDETRFAWQVGGGLDVWFTPHAALRLGGDYRHIPDSDAGHEHHSEARFQAAIVFGFGKR